MTDQPESLPAPDPDGKDGCARACRKKGAHTRVWGDCLYGIEPEPTVSMSHVYTDYDGYKSIGFDSYTAGQLADLIAPVINEGEEGFANPYDESYGRWLAEKVAKAIIHRHDPEGQR